MHLIFNELSLHGQFTSVAEFSGAIGRVMAIRGVAQKFEYDLHCSRETLHRSALGQQPLYAAAGQLSKDQQRALMQWLTRHGPFWEDAQAHSEDEWLECDGELVTGGALAEAAWAFRDGNACGMVSIAPSAWLRSPLQVDWVGDDGSATFEEVPNYWRKEDLERDLADSPPSVESWDSLARTAQIRFSGLTFADEAFHPLRGHPFNRGAAEGVIRLLTVLQELTTCFDELGEFTARGHALRTNHFAGDTAWFSDSSDTEKSMFQNQLTFRHPDKVGQRLFCPWHGKVRTQTIRVHFSWPIRASERVYVVYVGPKITKR